MVFHAILRQILKYRFSAIFSRKLSARAIFYYNYGVLFKMIVLLQNGPQSSKSVQMVQNQKFLSKISFRDTLYITL